VGGVEPGGFSGEDDIPPELKKHGETTRNPTFWLRISADIPMCASFWGFGRLCIGREWFYEPSADIFVIIIAHFGEWLFIHSRILELLQMGDLNGPLTYFENV
jgi:hypothetical protein